MKRIKLWWKQLWCKHEWKYIDMTVPSKYWMGCKKCGKQKDVEDD